MKEQFRPAGQLTVQPQTGYAGSGGNFMPGEAATQERSITQTQPQPAGAGTKENVEGSSVKKSQSSGKPTGTGDVTSQEKPTVVTRQRVLEKKVKIPLQRLEEKLKEKPREFLTPDELKQLIKDANHIARAANKQRAGLVGGSILRESMEAIDIVLEWEAALRKEAEKKGVDLVQLDEEIAMEAQIDRGAEVPIFERNTVGAAESQTEQLRQEWKAAFTPEELENPDLQSTIDFVITLGYGPETATSKDFVSIRAKDVVANTLLSDDDRAAKAIELLDPEHTGKFSEEEKEAIQAAVVDAHNEGKNEIGKDGNGAGVYNYTQDQLSRKAQILARVHLDKTQRRMLIEAGIAGAAVPAAEFATFNPAVYAGTPLAAYANQLKSVGEAGGADDDRISGIIDRVTADTGIPPADKTAFIAVLVNYKVLAEAADAARRGGGRRGRGGGGEEVNLEISQVSAKLAELGFNEAAYTDVTLKGIVREVLEKLDPRVGLDYDFLNVKFRSIIRTPGEEAEKLRSSLHELMATHDANRVTKLRLLGLYENIEMNPVQQAKLIEDVLEGHDNLIDEQFNALFAKADVNANSEFRDAIGQAGQLEIDSFLNTLTNAAETRTLPTGYGLTDNQVEKLREKSRVLKQLKDLRQDLHTVAYAINSNLGIPELRKFLKHFKAEYQDVAFRTNGVPQIMRLYENAMHQVAAENGGYIAYEDMVDTVGGERSRVEQIVLKQAKLAKAMKMPGFENMKEYEISRAISFARGMGVVMGNFFEIVAAKGMPEGIPLTSWWANPIIKRIAFFRQLMRFNQGGKNLTALAFHLEDEERWVQTPLGKVWTISDQKEILEKGYDALLKAVVGKDQKAKRWIQVLNPLIIGSMWTQTGWRWAQDKLNHTGAMLKLLGDNPINPLIGAGLWVEKQKGNLGSKDKLGAGDADVIAAVNRDLGVNFRVGETTKGELAELLIKKNLELAIKGTPLTLFNNLTELRHAVLGHYAGQITGQEGNISVVDGSELQQDMNMLSLLQEKLMGQRIAAYKGNRAINLYTEHTDINRVVEEEYLEGHLFVDQRNRLLRLVENIQHEFTAAHAGEHSPLEELMEDLKEKKWKVPFILGHDIPYEEIEFIKNGPDSVDRRGDDWEIVDATTGLINEYIESLSLVHKKEDLITGLSKIHRTLSGHDLSVANDVVAHLAEATTLWFRKDIRAMLPFAAGTTWGLRGDSSLAQVLGGREKMAWDRTDMDEFVNLIHGMGKLSHHQVEELREHTGATKELLVIGFGGAGQTIISFLLLAYLFYIIKKQMDEK